MLTEKQQAKTPCEWCEQPGRDDCDGQAVYEIISDDPLDGWKLCAAHLRRHDALCTAENIEIRETISQIRARQTADLSSIKAEHVGSGEYIPVAQANTYTPPTRDITKLSPDQIKKITAEHEANTWVCGFCSRCFDNRHEASLIGPHWFECLRKFREARYNEAQEAR